MSSETKNLLSDVTHAFFAGGTRLYTFHGDSEPLCDGEGHIEWDEMSMSDDYPVRVWTLDHEATFQPAETDEDALPTVYSVSITVMGHDHWSGSGDLCKIAKFKGILFLQGRVAEDVEDLFWRIDDTGMEAGLLFSYFYGAHGSIRKTKRPYRLLLGSRFRVHQNLRGNGLGSWCIQEVLPCYSDGMVGRAVPTHIQSPTQSDIDGLLSFYQQAGFEETARLTHKDDPNLPAELEFPLIYGHWGAQKPICWQKRMNKLRSLQAAISEADLADYPSGPFPC